MKALLLAFALFSSHPAYGAIFSISSDKSVYSDGENALLTATVDSKPIDEGFEFDLIGSLNGQPLPAQRITDYQFTSTAEEVSEPANIWEATLVIQDKSLAHNLKSAISFYEGQIEDLEEEIGLADPEEIPALELELARYESLRDAALYELASIRKPIQTLSLEFTVL